MEGDKTLREYLLDPVESERLQAVSFLLGRLESYTRALSLMLLTAASNAQEPSAAGDILAAHQLTKDLHTWIAQHWVGLGMSEQQPQEQSVPEPVSELRH